MFEPTSRYYHIEETTLSTADGRELAYKRRRFVPPPGALPLLVEVTVQQGERLDQITARVLGDPEQFWRICDANTALNPLDLVAQPGRRIRIPLPQP